MTLAFGMRASVITYGAFATLCRVNQGPSHGDAALDDRGQIVADTESGCVASDQPGHAGTKPLSALGPEPSKPQLAPKPKKRPERSTHPGQSRYLRRSRS